MNHLAIAHALIAIAKSQEKIAKETDSIRGWLVGVEKNTAVIAEQLERMNNRNKTTDNWEDNPYRHREDK